MVTLTRMFMMIFSNLISEKRLIELDRQRFIDSFSFLTLEGAYILFQFGLGYVISILIKYILI